MSGAAEESRVVLQQLLRFDTVNPPGDERPAQEHLASYLQDAGMAVELLGATDARPNLVASLDGLEDGPTLCLLSHMDTVLATPGEWAHGPWSGDVADGAVWGRGALDMKGQTAAEAVAVARLAREGWRPARGKLLVVCVVDEETGGSQGAQWITAHHPEKVRCDYLVNEGGGGIFEYDGRRLVGVCVAEKGVFRFRVITEGVAGHASMPRLGDNALLKMAPLLERMRDRQPAFDLTPEPQALLEAVGERADDLAAALERTRERDPLMALILEPMLGVSLAPTRIRASEKINVIPSRAELAVDCRVPPGLGTEHARERIREVLGEEGYRLEFTEEVMGNRSPTESPLMDFIRDWVSQHDPQATCVPTVLPGFTDSRTFRDAFPECVAYGFMPHRHTTYFETAPLIHSADERVDVRDLAYGTQFFTDLVTGLLG